MSLLLLLRVREGCPFPQVLKALRCEGVRELTVHGSVFVVEGLLAPMAERVEKGLDVGRSEASSPPTVEGCCCHFSIR
jgi:hypothetical protein